MAGFRSWLTNSTYLHLSTYNKKTEQGSVLDWPTQLIYICQHTTKRQSRVIHLPEQASNQGRPYLSLLLKPKSLHFNCASCAIGGMVRVPLLPRVSCSFALGRRHQVPGISYQVPQVPGTRCQVPQVPGTRCQVHQLADLHLSWLFLSHSVWVLKNSGVWLLVCVQHVLHNCLVVDIIYWSPHFHGICKIISWNIFWQKRRLYGSLKKCQAYSGVPNLLTESPLLFFPTFIFWLQGWEVIVISMQKIALGIKCRI